MAVVLMTAEQGISPMHHWVTIYLAWWTSAGSDGWPIAKVVVFVMAHLIVLAVFIVVIEVVVNAIRFIVRVRVQAAELTANYDVPWARHKAERKEMLETPRAARRVRGVVGRHHGTNRDPSQRP